MLTNELLGDDVTYERDSRGIFRVTRSSSTAPTIERDFPDLRRFFKALYTHTRKYYYGRLNPQGCFERTPHYEDFAYLAIQLSEAIMHERDNPAVDAFTRELTHELQISSDILQGVANDAAEVIVDHVSARLQGLKPSPDHLACMRQIVAQTKAGVPIITLNHDCLIETVLRQDGVRLNDMTQLREDGRRVVTVDLSSTGVNLFKLHGSIDWFRWHAAKMTSADRPWTQWTGAWAGPPNSQNRWEVQGPPRPALLVGRFNKELSYNSSPFIDLFAAARTALNSASHLVVSGYSFGDKAVNTMIVDWMYGAAKGTRRLIVAHETPEVLQRAARGAIGNRWSAWEAQDVLRVLGKHLCAVTAEELWAAIA